MTTQTRQITAASLRVSRDLGHGGATAHYSIRRAGVAHDVAVTISRHFPAPGERRFRPSVMEESLPKDFEAAEEFLRRLSAEHKVSELGDRPCPTVFLHPTFYHFEFADAGGNTHRFEYSVEAGHHHSEAHRRLVEDFETFFEGERLARDFSARARPVENLPGEPARPWWRLW